MFLFIYLFFVSSKKVITANLKQSEKWELSKEGLLMAEQGSHEANVFNSIPEEGLLQSELLVSF